MRTSAVLVCCAALAGCGGGAIGEACSTIGSTSECEDGAICDIGEAGAFECVKLCTEDFECGTDEVCSGVSGTDLEACHVEDE